MHIYKYINEWVCVRARGIVIMLSHRVHLVRAMILPLCGVKKKVNQSGRTHTNTNIRIQIKNTLCSSQVVEIYEHTTFGDLPWASQVPRAQTGSMRKKKNMKEQIFQRTRSRACNRVPTFRRLSEFTCYFFQANLCVLLIFYRFFFNFVLIVYLV